MKDFAFKLFIAHIDNNPVVICGRGFDYTTLTIEELAYGRPYFGAKALTNSVLWKGIVI